MGMGILKGYASSSPSSTFSPPQLSHLDPYVFLVRISGLSTALPIEAGTLGRADLPNWASSRLDPVGPTVVLVLFFLLFSRV